ncbi:MAG: bifunctional UDP-N-acetylmuramoyl-tripeptide:D-alanyl-D-alanine ligase/alanine racemase [Bacteroidia bacterium]|nr:bifunctional UDP-N-acetylmuramoyl-tripeptide:D-alanyl-D-alanine ligase/alanine racemase [Bacteroidia bacterium]
MTNYSASEIASIIRGKVNGNGDVIINRLLIDSRNLAFPLESLFIAIRGDRHDGNTFIPDLYQKGVRCFIVSKIPACLCTDATFIVVSDTLLALQDLVAFHRSKFNYPVIGITGSNGKTVVKEWLFELLKEEKIIVRNPRSYNSQVGVPLSVWMMDETHQLGIFEAGISKVNEMERLAKVIRPDLGIFTNVGPAHQENFGDTRQKVVEKLKLFEKSKTLIFCNDYPAISELVPAYCEKNGIKPFTWGKSNEADLQILKIEKGEKTTFIEGLFKGENQKIKILFTDDASIENSIICWVTLLALGYNHTFISTQILNLAPVAMRLQMNEGLNNCTIINDTYNSDLASLRIALHLLSQQNQHPHRILILSDILQSGYNEEILYSEVSDMVNNHKVDMVIGIGTAISRFSDKFKVNKKFYYSSSEFIQNLASLKLHNSTILLKGARKFEFEKISKRLQQKAHETVLEVNLNAFVSNLNAYKSLLKPGTGVMAMVKAFSYGSGLFEIANLLQFEHVSYLTVAYADEGVELRQGGISMPILVMSPEPESFEAMLEYNLEPELYNLRIMQMFQTEVKRLGKQNVNVHIKLDTGMKRLGFEESEIDLLLFKLKKNPWLKVRSVFTHLTSTDDVRDDHFTFRQVELFNSMVKQIENSLDYPFLKHVLNSAGVERFPNYSFDLVRLGIGLYGFCTGNALKGKLTNVISLKTVISQIKSVPADETVGYNRKGVLLRDSLIATIPIGYADGLDRKLSNGAGVFKVNGVSAPTVGNVCMDMCMIDVTDANAHEGDEVIIFDSAADVMKMSEIIGTIPYEILTGISRRVKRIYYHE